MTGFVPESPIFSNLEYFRFLGMSGNLMSGLVSGFPDFPVRSDTSKSPETGRAGLGQTRPGPVSELVGRIFGSDTCLDVRTLVSVGGRDTNQKEQICTLSARTKKERHTPFE